MIQLQRTSETSEIIEAYNCNIEGRKREPDAGSTMAAESAGIGGSRCLSRAVRPRRIFVRPCTEVEARGGRPEKRKGVTGGGRVDKSSCSRRGRRHAGAGGRGSGAHGLCDAREGGGAAR